MFSYNYIGLYHVPVPTGLYYPSTYSVSPVMPTACIEVQETDR